MEQRSLLKYLRPTRGLSTSVRASALAFAALALATAPVLAAHTIPAVGGTIHASGGWNTATGKPDTCSSTEWLFVINGISSNASKINAQGKVIYQAYPTSISVSFDNAADIDVAAITGVEIFANPPSSTVHYSIPANSTNSQYTLDGATAVFGPSVKPPGGPATDMTYNNFVLSHGPCATPPPPPPSPPPPPPVGATPELDSLVLFGSGAAGVGGYLLMRLRGRKRNT